MTGDLTITQVRRAVLDGDVASHIAGFVVAADRPSAAPLEVAPLLRAFVGPYGDDVVEGLGDGLAWAGVRPGKDQRHSAWSAYADQRGVCVLEGEFYGAAWGAHPVVGDDPGLARRGLEAVLREGPGALTELNGLFSGFVALPGRLYLVVDRLGTRPLYYRVQQGRLEATTNLYGFRGSASAPRVDPLSLNEHLILGFPTDNKTVFEGIRLVPPGSVVQWTAETGSVQCWRYHRFPERLTGESIADGAARVQAALDAYVQNADDCLLALSGGKDSRVVLAALCRAQRPVRPITIVTGSDVAAARRLAARLGTALTTVAKDPETDGLAFHWDAAILQDGGGAGWPFIILAAMAGLDGRPLMTGFSGDCLSGSWFGVRPWQATSLEALAREEYEARAPRVPPSLVGACLRRDLVVPVEAVMASWIESYRRAETGDLMATYVAHRLSHRNRRRVAPIFHSMRSLCTVLHPFADRAVMDAYLALPRRSLMGQAVHSLVAMAGPAALGDCPTDTFWWPLRFEMRAHRVLAMAKRLGRAWRARAGAAGKLVGGQRRHLAIASESDLFNAAALQRHQEELAVGAVALGATAMHVAGVTGVDLPTAPPPLFLRRAEAYAGR
jgi:hypothetical protein